MLEEWEDDEDYETSCVVQHSHFGLLFRTSMACDCSEPLGGSWLAMVGSLGTLDRSWVTLGRSGALFGLQG